MPGSPGGKEVGRLSLKVLPDTSEFLDELKAFAERVEAEVKIELKVDLDDASAQEQLKELQARMEAADLTLNIDTELDTLGAMEHLDLLLAAMQGTADLHHVHIEAEFDGAAATAAAATTEAISTGSAVASQMGKQIALWGPLIFIAAVGIAALAPALLVLLPLVAGVGLGVGAIIAGWKQLKPLLQPIVDAFKGMRKEIGLVLTAGLAPMIKEFVSGFIPVLKSGLATGAELMNALLTSLLGFLSSTTGIELMGQLFDGLYTALAPLMQAAGPLVEMFVRLSIAALPGLEMMSRAILDVITNLNEFLATKDIGPQISASMADLGAVLQIIGKLAADLWGPLMAAAPGVIALLAGVGAAFGGMFKLMQPLFQLMSDHVGTMKGLGAALTIVAVVMGTVAAATVVSSAVMATWSGLVKAAGLVTKAWAGAQWLFNAAMSANPILLVVVGLAALAAGLVYAYTHFEGFRNVVDVTWAFIKTATAGLVSFISDHWKLLAAIILLPVAPIVGLLAVIVSNFGAIKAFVIGVFTSIGSVLSTVFTFITEHWRAFAVGLLLIITGPIGGLVAFIVLNFTTIKGFVVAIWNAIVGFLAGVMSRIVGVFSAGWSAVRAAVSAAISVVKAVISAGIAGVLAYVRGISAVGSFFKSAFNTAKSAVSTGVTSIINYVKDIPGKAKDALGSLGGTLASAGRQLIQGFIDGLASKFKDVKGKLSELTKKLTDWKGPESLDKVILYDAGSLVIGGFIEGLESQYGATEKSLGKFTNGLSDMASFDAEAALNFSGTKGILPQLDGLLSLDVGGEATKLIIENWDTGVGHMRNIAADAVEGYEEATTARSNPKETP